jgi:hypothetical protein
MGRETRLFLESGTIPIFGHFGKHKFIDKISGGGGGSRTRVREHSARASTYIS